MRRATACTLMLILALAAAALAGCGSDSSREDAAAAARARAQERAHAQRMAIGRRRFAKHCASCHTLGGRRYTAPVIEWEAPNLDHVRLARSYVRDRVEVGGPAMASFTGEMPAEELRALVDFVTETAGREVVDADRPASLLAQGRELFAQNCAACHGIDGRDMTGRPTYSGMDFNLVQPSERFVIARMKAGVLPGEAEPLMPSFKGRLTGAQMRAVAAYVTSTAGE